LDVISKAQTEILSNMRNVRGVSAQTREAVLTTLLDSTERLKASSPDFYPSSVQM